jgi:hypothetical protein
MDGSRASITLLYGHNFSAANLANNRFFTRSESYVMEIARRLQIGQESICQYRDGGLDDQMLVFGTDKITKLAFWYLRQMMAVVASSS